jgi:hypothetical protein
MRLSWKLQAQESAGKSVQIEIDSTSCQPSEGCEWVGNAIPGIEDFPKVLKGANQSSETAKLLRWRVKGFQERFRIRQNQRKHIHHLFITVQDELRRTKNLPRIVLRMISKSVKNFDCSRDWLANLKHYLHC